jgi:glycosyl transferase family 22 (putative mannosyltransferase)
MWQVTPNVASGDLTPRRCALVLAALLAFSLATKLAFAWHFDGFLTGDDLEVVEAALKYSSDFDYAPWSLRNLFHPVVLVAPLLTVAGWFGKLTPECAAFLAAVPTAVVSTAAVALLFILARRLGWSIEVALAAAFLYAVHWLPWAYGGTQYPRPISTAFFLAAILLTTAARRRLLFAFLAGFLVALACAVRFSEGILLLPLLGFAWFRTREPLVLAGVGSGFATGAFLFLGLFDVLTWGEPFHSLREFVRIMFSNSPPPSASGDKPLYHYVANVVRWTSPVHLALILVAVGDRRLRAPAAMVATIVVLLSLFRYKQYRYLQAAIPFVALAAAVGWDRLRRKLPRLAVLALALAVAYGAVASVLLLRGKSQPAVAAARFIARMEPAPKTVAFEQAWAYGERLYLRDARIRDVAPSRPLDPKAVRDAVGGADAAAFYVNDLGFETRRILSESGMRAVGIFHRPGGKPVVVFRRPPQSPSSARSSPRSAGIGATISISSLVAGWRRTTRSACSACLGNSVSARFTSASGTRSNRARP